MALNNNNLFDTVINSIQSRNLKQIKLALEIFFSAGLDIAEDNSIIFRYALDTDNIDIISTILTISAANNSPIEYPKYSWLRELITSHCSLEVLKILNLED